MSLLIGEWISVCGEIGQRQTFRFSRLCRVSSLAHVSEFVNVRLGITHHTSSLFAEIEENWLFLTALTPTPFMPK